MHKNKINIHYETAMCERGLKKKEMAQRLNITPSTLSHWLSRPLTPVRALRMQHALDTFDAEYREKCGQY